MAEAKPSTEAAEPLIDWSVAAERIADAMPVSLEKVLRKAADDFYAGLLDDVQGYLRDNALFNLGTQLDIAKRQEAAWREALGQVAEAAGTMRRGWPCGPTAVQVADAAVAEIVKLKEAADAARGPAIAAFDAWLTERAAWLKSERERGGDWEHLLTRETELGYVAEKFRAAIAKAEGQSNG